jgi:hypothetical protein
MKKLFKLFLVSALILSCWQTAIAQRTKKERQAAKEAAIKKIVNEMHYVFEANYVNPSRGDGRSLTSEYDMKVSKDTIVAYLPYFGRAYVAPNDLRGGGIDFTLTNFEYSVTEGKKGGWDIVIKPKDKNISNFKDVQTMGLSISTDGYAFLQVISTNRDPISFNGTIEELKGQGRNSKETKTKK